MARTSLKEFDRDADFEVLRPFRIAGIDQHPGQPFDKSLASVRTHRQLYNQRRVGVVEKIEPLPGTIEEMRRVLHQVEETPPPPPAKKKEKKTPPLRLSKRDPITKKYWVMRGRKKVSRPMSKRDAEDFIDANTPKSRGETLVERQADPRSRHRPISQRDRSL